MGKYFGTDGFRGEANVTLTAKHAFKIGRFLGWYYCSRRNDGNRARIVIGKDPRRSSYMLEYALNDQGEKMDDETSARGEEFLDGKSGSPPYAVREDIGKTIDFVEGRNRYGG